MWNSFNCHDISVQINCSYSWYTTYTNKGWKIINWWILLSSTQLVRQYKNKIDRFYTCVIRFYTCIFFVKQCFWKYNAKNISYEQTLSHWFYFFHQCVQFSADSCWVLTSWKTVSEHVKNFSLQFVLKFVPAISMVKQIICHSLIHHHPLLVITNHNELTKNVTSTSTNVSVADLGDGCSAHRPHISRSNGGFWKFW